MRVKDSQRQLATVSRIAASASQDKAAEGQPAPVSSGHIYPPEYYEAKRLYGSDTNRFG